MEGEEGRRHKGRDLSRNSNLKLLSLSCHKSHSVCETLVIWRYLEVMLSPRVCSTCLDIPQGENPDFSLIKQWKPQQPPAFLLPQILNTHRSEKPINICRKFSKCHKSFVTPQQSEPACFTLSPGGTKPPHTTFMAISIFFLVEMCSVMLC